MQKLYEKIEALSLEEFEQLLKFVNKTRKQRAKNILIEAQQQAARLSTEIDLHNIQKGNYSTKPPKYCDPSNPENTWSGYGRQPDWMKQYLENGGNKEDLLISSLKS